MLTGACVSLPHSAPQMVLHCDTPGGTHQSHHDDADLQSPCRSPSWEQKHISIKEISLCFSRSLGHNGTTRHGEFDWSRTPQKCYGKCQMHAHTCTPPLLAISEKLGRTAARRYVEWLALLAPWGSVPDVGYPSIPGSSRNLQQQHSPVPNRDQRIFVLLCAWCPLLVVTACGQPGHA